MRRGVRTAKQWIGWCLVAMGGAVTGCGNTVETSGFNELTTANTGAGGSAQSTGGATTGRARGAGGAAGGGGHVSSGSGSGVIGGDRPVNVHVPPTYDPGAPSPLLILLHGYSANGDLQEFYLDLSKEADERGYLFATPSGLKDKQGLNFWNATDACCNLSDIDVDDSTYLRGVIDDIRSVFNVDERRIYLAGHSNGGFMAHRMACDHADIVAGIASLAGATHIDAKDCQPTDPVAILNIHGSLDAVIWYAGGSLFGNPYPGAEKTSKRWAAYNGCSSTADETPANINIEGLLLGNETTVKRYDIGCKPGGVVEHWRIRGGSHLPVFNSSFRKNVFDFFDAHPKP